MEPCPPNLFHEIVRHATDSVICADAHGHTIWVNPQFTRMSGYTLEDMAGRTPGSVLQGPDTDPVTVADIREALKERAEITTEILNYRKDGTPYWIRLTITPLFDESGTLTNFLSVERDVTMYRELIDEAAAASERERQKNGDLKLIGQMSSWLFSAQSLDELVAIVGESMAHIFPHANGTLYLYSNSRDCLEYAGGWGTQKDREEHFKPDACWALRRGKGYTYGAQEISLLCGHVAQPRGAYACIPIIAHGDMIGLLHFDFYRLPAGGMNAAERLRLERKLELAQICVEQISLATAIVRLQDELRTHSVKDPLTGLWNRRWFLDMAANELRRANRSSKSLAMVMLDVDHFKRFNDEHGHDAGDTALKVLAAHLADVDREGVYAARFGGEEFAVICANMDSGEAVELIDRLRDALAKAPILHAGQRLPSLSFSAGVAMAQSVKDLRTLIACADRALYAAKAAGRHQTAIFDETAMPDHGMRALSSNRQRVSKTHL
jgi:diguanylate cyclase (GGDEF)-like protein/PAS domain S-box-containing protein